VVSVRWRPDRAPLEVVGVSSGGALRRWSRERSSVQSSALERETSPPQTSSELRRIRQRVVVALSDAPVSRSISLEDHDMLIVRIEGACARVRLSIDGTIVVDHEVSDEELAEEIVELALDRAELRQWTRYATVLVEVCERPPQHYRATNDAGPWKSAATLIVRDTRALRVVVTMLALLVLMALFWLIAATSAGSWGRVAWDVATALSVVPAFFFAAGVGGSRGPRLVLGWIVVAALLSVASQRYTTTVFTIEEENRWMISMGVPMASTRYTRDEVVVRGDRTVVLGGETWWASRGDESSGWGSASGTRRLVLSRRPTMAVIERRAADALLIPRGSQADMGEQPWVAVPTDTPLATERSRESDGFAIPTVLIRSGPRVRATDLALGPAATIRFFGLGGSALELTNRRAPYVLVRAELDRPNMRLWMGRLGEGWIGRRSPIDRPGSSAEEFACEPGANVITSIAGDRTIIERIEGARFRTISGRYSSMIVCFADDGTSFSDSSSVTIVVRKDIGHELEWRYAAPRMHPQWQTIRLVDRSDGREELLAVTTRPDATTPSRAEVLQATLSESLLDVREIAAVSTAARTVLWRRGGARRTVVLLNVPKAERVPTVRQELVVLVGDGAASREARAELVRGRDENVLRELDAQTVAPR
jgi:hypothetical protein